MDVGKIKTLATEFAIRAQALEDAGLATPDFVKVSVSIATDLQSAIDHIPISADAVVDGALRWQDRAVIRAMCFPDAVRKEVRDSKSMEALMTSQNEISFVLLSERIAQELVKVVF